MIRLDSDHAPIANEYDKNEILNSLKQNVAHIYQAY